MPHGEEVYPNDITSFYDTIEENYVLYEYTYAFDSKYNKWPLTAWRAGLDLELIERYTAPAGPGVNKHSLIACLRSFSCGC